MQMTIKVLVAASCFCLTALAAVSNNTYLLGPDDQILVRAIDVAEFPQTPIRIERDGTISLPLIGRVQAAGRTVGELETDIQKPLKEYIKTPHVTVSIAEFRSRPVSVLGSVTRPGIVHIRGQKTLWEAISEAGGLTNTVGETVKITRRSQFGPLPLPASKLDSTGDYYVATVSVRSLRETASPEENIELMEHDVISVSAADIVYIVGHVNRVGGYVTNGSISVLQALALSGGLMRFAKPEKAHILRLQPGTDQRQILPVDLARVLAGKGEDILLKPQDILFVPHSRWKEYTLQMVTSATAAASTAAIFTGLGTR